MIKKLKPKLNQQLGPDKGSRTGVGKLRPAGQLRPAKRKSVAREHAIYMNGMRPAKEIFVAREHVNVAREAKIVLS